MPGGDDGGDDGTWRFAPGIEPGSPVTAGQVIAWMGDSGNSEGSVPHAHVEIRTPDGTAVNPFWSLVRAQRDVELRDRRGRRRHPDGRRRRRRPAGRLDRRWPSPAAGPGSGTTAARMWIRPSGFTPIDGGGGAGRRSSSRRGLRQPHAPSTIPAELGAILATIRQMESGGDYTAQARGSTASGAYQFIDSTWNGYGGYRRAADAPPPVQDAKAVEFATSILERNGGDVTAIPVTWYIGRVPVGAEYDRVPRPDAGNRLTPREYQQRWLALYDQMLGEPGRVDRWLGRVGAARHVRHVPHRRRRARWARRPRPHAGAGLRRRRRRPGGRAVAATRATRSAASRFLGVRGSLERSQNGFRS